MKSFETPVLFLVFNRPEETARVFEAIRMIAPLHFYIAADGPRENKPGEDELCERVKKIVTNIDWNCKVKTLFRVNNIGCKKAVSEAIQWFFTNVEQGIILEDDCLPDLSFFDYCEQLLEKYKEDENIISIGGTNLGYKFDDDYSYAFSRVMNMWGWATWRRSSNLIDYRMEKWKGLTFKKLFLHKRVRENFFSLDYNWIKLLEKYFNLTALGKMNTWDYQWIFTQLYYKKKSIFPSRNLIKNIGFSNNATHTFNPDHPVTHLDLQSLTFPLKHPENIINDKCYERKFIKKVWFNYKKESLYTIWRSDFLNSSAVLKTINFFRAK